MQILYQLSICFTQIVAVRIRPGTAGQTSVSQCADWRPPVIWTHSQSRRQKVKVNIAVVKAGISVPAVEFVYWAALVLLDRFIFCSVTTISFLTMGWALLGLCLG